MTVEWEMAPPGIRLCVSREPLKSPGPALFLDRDGVIVEDTGYLCRREDVRLIDGAAGLIRAANRMGIPVLVATNQSGVARGLFGWREFDAVQVEISERLARADASLDAVAACPYHPDFTQGYGPEHDRYRKPGPGLIDLLARRMNIDPAASWMVGDQPRDIRAARAAGLAGAVLIGAPNRAASPDTAAGPEDSRFQVLECGGPEDARNALTGTLFP